MTTYVSSKGNQSFEQLKIKSNIKKVNVNGINYQFDENKALKSGADGYVFIGTQTFGYNKGPQQIIIKKAKENGKEAQENEVLILNIAGQDNGLIKKLGYDKEKKYLYLEKGDGALNDENLMKKTSVKVRQLMIKQVGSGLKKLHSKDITHQDVNTKNMIAFGEGAKLTDFGNSAYFDNNKSEIDKLTNDAMILINSSELNEAEKNEVRRGCKLIKSVQKANDRKDYVKASYNILVGKVKDLQIPENFREELEPFKKELGGKYNNLVTLFSNARRGIIPNTIDSIRNYF